MLYYILFLVCLGASTVGAVCGIGGGIIIKPILDALGILEVGTISFLSGCTVLSMTVYSIGKAKQKKELRVSSAIGIPLAFGAAIGGLIGKELFSHLSVQFSNKEKIGLVQASFLLVITIGTLVYTIYKEKIKTYYVTNKIAIILIGFILGSVSVFLGIGGGPINLILLSYFFSMGTKKAVENSLYIICFSQIVSIISFFITKSIPTFPIGYLLVMISGGIGGGICGRIWNKHIEEHTVDKLFIGLMCIMIAINVFNVYQFFYI